MSNSKNTLQKLFCLDDLWLDKLEMLDTEIHLHARKTSKTAICPLCGARSNRIHKKNQRLIKHMFLDDKIIYLKLMVRSFKCKRCGTFRETISGIDRRQTSARYRSFVIPKIRDRSFASVSQEFNLSASSVARATTNMINLTQVSWPKESFALGLDGHSFSGHDMMITVTDVTHKKLLTILPNDQQVTVRRFLLDIPENIKQNVQSVCIDMDHNLLGAVQKSLPNTKIVVDKFHVIQYFNHHLAEMRKVYTTSSFPLPKKLLQRNKEDLNDDERRELDKVFKHYPPIFEFWKMKEIMRGIYSMNDAKQAQRRFNGLLAGLESDVRPRWQKLYRTLLKWGEGIMNYFVFRVTNAYTEGVHTKIKLLKRISYGFRNRANYIAKMTLAFLPFMSLIECF